MTHFLNAQQGPAGYYETTERTMARGGTPRKATGRLNLRIPNWNTPYFGGCLPNFLTFPWAYNPPQSQTGIGGAVRNCRTGDGAARIAAGRLNIRIRARSPRISRFRPQLRNISRGQGRLSRRPPGEEGDTFLAQRPAPIVGRRVL